MKLKYLMAMIHHGSIIQKRTLLLKTFRKYKNNADVTVTCNNLHCVKSVRIRSYCGLHFPAFGQNAEDTPYLSVCLSVFSPNAGKC